MTRLLLIACLVLIVVVAPPADPVWAQSNCVGYQQPDWTVDQGSYGDANVVVAGNYIGPSGPVKRASVTRYYDGKQRVDQLQVQWFANGLPDQFPIEAQVKVYDGGSDVKTYYTQITPNAIPGAGWVTETINLGGAVGNRIEVTIQHRNDGNFANIGLAFQVMEVCTTDLNTPTPSPTVEIPTATNTPTDTPAPTATATDTATNTSTPSHTPTDTNTPHPSITPTVTPTPSNTPLPSSTATSSRTPSITPTATPRIAGVAAGGFNTPIPPKGCSDPFNPCGALPFPVPQFPTLSLPSPTALASVTMRATATIANLTPQGSATPNGTATAMSTSTAGTPSQNEVGMADFATQVAGIQVAIEVTAQFNDADGNAVDLRNGANQIGATMGELFGFIRALPNLFIGRAGMIVAFMILILAFSLLTKVIVTVAPILLAIIRWIMRIINTLKPL